MRPSARPAVAARSRGRHSGMVLVAFSLTSPGWRGAVKLVQDHRREFLRKDGGGLQDDDDDEAALDAVLPSYRAAIRSCGEAGKWKTALTLLRQLEADGAAPDPFCYSETLSLIHI